MNSTTWSLSVRNAECFTEHSHRLTSEFSLLTSVMHSPWLPGPESSPSTTTTALSRPSSTSTHRSSHASSLFVRGQRGMRKYCPVRNEISVAPELRPSTNTPLLSSQVSNVCRAAYSNLFRNAKIRTSLTMHHGWTTGTLTCTAYQTASRSYSAGRPESPYWSVWATGEVWCPLWDDGEGVTGHHVVLFGLQHVTMNQSSMSWLDECGTCVATGYN